VLRNRVALLAAARDVFAARGLDAPLEQIARQAGVGIGTLYRHFPTRVDLIDAIQTASFSAYLAIAEEALARDDPWDGFVHFLEGTCALEAANRGWSDLMSTRLPGAVTVDAAHTQMYDLAVRILRRAQDSGHVRPDLTAEDLTLLRWATGRIQEVAGDTAPGAWRRHLALLLDGYRASAAHPAPVKAPTPKQIHGAMLQPGRRRARG
jgi:AcrR family transcriptional regulator